MRWRAGVHSVLGNNGNNHNADFFNLVYYYFIYNSWDYPRDTKTVPELMSSLFKSPHNIHKHVYDVGQ